MWLSEAELAAYADGELEGAEAARVLLAVAASPELMQRVEMHRVMRAKLAAHFAPVLEQEVPERLTALIEQAPPTRPPAGLRPEGEAGEGALIVDPRPREVGRRWGWVLAPAVAAALVAAALLA